MCGQDAMRQALVHLRMFLPRFRQSIYLQQRIRVKPIIFLSCIPAPEAEDDHQELSEAIIRLPDKDKEIILLYYYQNMNIREIASALGLAPSSVSNRLKKARERLKDLLERGEYHG